MITYDLKKELFKYTISVTNSTVTPIDIFLYRIGLSGEHIYEHICTVDEIEKYPSSLPTTESPVFFRKYFVEVSNTSITNLEETYQHMKDTITDLDIDYIKYVELNKVGSTESVTVNEEEI